MHNGWIELTEQEMENERGGILWIELVGLGIATIGLLLAIYDIRKTALEHEIEEARFQFATDPMGLSDAQMQLLHFSTSAVVHTSHEPSPTYTPYDFSTDMGSAMSRAEAAGYAQ